MKNIPDLPDISFLDRPEILFFLFHPVKTRPSPYVSEKMLNLSFLVDDEICVNGTIHLAFDPETAPNVLFFHGNGEVVADYNDIGPFYTKMGFNFAVVDYRGYGTRNGFPTYSSMIEDGHKVFHQFEGFMKENGMKGPLFVMGRSLGSASALELAANYPKKVDGLILEGGFAHTYQLLINLGVNPQILDSARELSVSNLEKIKKVKQPVLIIHGSKDEIIPVSDGHILYEVAQNEIKDELIIPWAGHNTLMLLGLNDYMKRISRFVKRVESIEATRRSRQPPL